VTSEKKLQLHCKEGQWPRWRRRSSTFAYGAV
jgi:hypothetical protein